MILLDTNYLIRMLVKGSAAATEVSGWIAAREHLCTSAICWYEFVSGPVDDEGVVLVTSALADRIIPFTADHAREASRLYNGTGRSRRMRIDAMIAAATIVAGAVLATANREDFFPFESFGLELVEAQGSGEPG